MADKSPLREQSDFTREHYAYLSDDLNFSRGISQIAPEEIGISSEERKNSSEESNETSEESSDKSEEFRHSLGRKSNISPERFENRERLL